MRLKQPEMPVFDDFKGDLLTVLSSRPLPPGSRVAFGLPLDEGPPIPVQGKVVHAGPLDDDPSRFRMTLRIHSQTREERDRLASAALTKQG